MEETKNTPWRTIICYRNGDPKQKNLLPYTKQLAKVLYDNIKKDAKLAPVLFEEDLEQSNISFDEPGIKQFMPNICTFIPIITPDFFDDIKDLSYRILDEKTINDAYDNEVFVYIKEFAYAICNRCHFVPIYIADQNGKVFVKQKNNWQNIRAILLKIVALISNRCGYPYNESECSDYIGEFFTRVNPQIEKIEDVKKIISKDLTATEKFIKSFYTKMIYRDDTISMELLTDLKKIHHVMIHNGHSLDYKNNIMDTIAYSRMGLAKEQKKEAKYFCISSAYIRGVQSLKDANRGTKTGKGRGFEDIQRVCFAKNSNKNYYYWPLTMSTNKEKGINPSIFNVCAICFGAMMLNNWNEYDRELLSDINGFDKRFLPETINENINKAINLLLSLRDYKELSWISTWSFGEDNRVGFAEGTINQTTLSISALLTCGFLDRNSVNNDYKKLFDRIQFIDNSLAWLKSKITQVDQKDPDEYYWGDGYTDIFNLSLTLFCLDVYLKFYEKITTEIKLEEISKLPLIRGKEFSAYCEDIKEIIDGVVLYLNHKVPEIIVSEQHQHNKALIYAKVLKSYCGYISYERQHLDLSPNENNPEIYGSASKLASDALLYLYQNRELVESFNINTCPMLIEVMPHIISKDELGNKTLGENDVDNYDNCAELLFIDAMIKAIETKEIIHSANIPVNDIMKKIEDSIKWFRDNKTTRPTNAYIGIEGHNDLKSPIYAYYYYRMVIYDYLHCIGKATHEAT